MPGPAVYAGRHERSTNQPERGQAHGALRRNGSCLERAAGGTGQASLPQDQRGSDLGNPEIPGRRRSQRRTTKEERKTPMSNAWIYQKTEDVKKLGDKQAPYYVGWYEPDGR